jgi:hypothetical protein
LENFKEAITAWRWAEDQKAVAFLKKRSRKHPVAVAV